MDVNDDNAKIQKLAYDLELLNSEVPQTRGFFKRLLSVLYCDACGYSYGMKYTSSWQISLACGGGASLGALIWGGYVYNEPTTIVNGLTDKINPDYKVKYATGISKAELIGATHNEAIVRTMKTQQVVQSDKVLMDERLIQTVNTQVNQCIGEYVNRGIVFSKNDFNSELDFPIYLQSGLLDFIKVLAERENFEGVHQMAKEFLPSEGSMLDLLKQYVIYIGNVGEKEDIRTFTTQLNQAIDGLSISAENTEYLKTIVAIAENSYSLWKVE